RRPRPAAPSWAHPHPPTTSPDGSHGTCGGSCSGGSRSPHSSHRQYGGGGAGDTRLGRQPQGPERGCSRRCRKRKPPSDREAGRDRFRLLPQRNLAECEACATFRAGERSVLGVEVCCSGPSSRVGVPAARFFLLKLRVPEQVNESWTPGVVWRSSRGSDGTSPLETETQFMPLTGALCRAAHLE
ncbi:hypothetical protein EI555_002469, partial [Monodon monoceros]